MLDLDSKRLHLEKNAFVEEMKNMNTKEKTTGDVNILYSWIGRKGGGYKKG